MSTTDEIFPEKPPAIRRPRPSAAPSDFDDPAVRAKARALHAASMARYGAAPKLAECMDPMLCQVGDHAHRLTIGGPRPAPEERRVSHLRTWQWDDAGLAWRCVAVHGSVRHE